MNALDLVSITNYVEENIGSFHEKRLERLRSLKLPAVLRRKNPYLFKAKNILTAAELVKGIVDAHLSSQEETMFGDFLEALAIFVNQQVYGGIKPDPSYLNGLDLIFQRDGKLFVVEIKSGTNWGNSSQIKKMMDNFNIARAVLPRDYPGLAIVCVNGCCYGRDNQPSKTRKEGRYLKICGQEFWRLISGNDQLYIDIVDPLGHRAKARNEEFDLAYARILNKFTLEFSVAYCNDGLIDWGRLVSFVSQRHGTAVDFSHVSTDSPE